MAEGSTGSFSSPKVDFMVDTGHPIVNRAVDGFLKIGAVGIAKTAAEETYDVLMKEGSNSSQKFEYSLKRVCKEGACWGTVAGVYVGLGHGVEKIRGTKDWKNALISGAVTGAILSAASNRNRDKIVMDAIAGGAVATAAEFLNYLT